MMFYEENEDQEPQYLRWIIDTRIEVQQKWPMSATRQRLNTWAPILFDALNPDAAPTNPENYP